MRAVRSSVWFAIAALVALMAGGASWIALRAGDDVVACRDAPLVSDLPAIAAGGDVDAHFELVASIEGALALAQAPDGRLLIATKQGLLWQVAGRRRAEVVLDLTDEVSNGIEQGLLGVAVDPRGRNIAIYGTWRDGTARVVELALTTRGVDPSTRRTILSLDVPTADHNGGRLAFGVDGSLFLGMGDGGDAGAAQDPESPFGKLLRIDPVTGEWTAWASGLRNPWGWSFDGEGGDLWVGDVGEQCFEEISVIPLLGNGANFGWPYLEGAHEFEDGAPPDDLVEPLHEYPHETGRRCSVIGGFAYRGAAIPDLAGTYIWSDLCLQEIYTLRRARDEVGWLAGDLRGPIPPGIVAYAKGIDGELYVLSITDGVFKIVP